MKQVDSLQLTLLGLGIWLLGLLTLPLDLLTRINLILYLAIFMFLTSAIYFATLIYKLKRLHSKLPIALQSLAILSVLALATTTMAARQIQNPELSVSILFFYAGIFLYTSVKGGHG